jgi:hypothetical protein
MGNMCNCDRKNKTEIQNELVLNPEINIKVEIIPLEKENEDIFSVKSSAHENK